jgi:hypothetical protein
VLTVTRLALIVTRLDLTVTCLDLTATCLALTATRLEPFVFADSPPTKTTRLPNQPVHGPPDPAHVCIVK